MDKTFNLKIFIIIFAVIVVAAAGFLAYKTFYLPAEIPSGISAGEPAQISTPAPEEVIKPKPEAPAPAPKPEAPKIFPGFKIYKNAEFGFEMQYPEAWQASEEPIENVRGEQTKAIYFKKPGSDLRFAVLPRDGLSYGLPADSGKSSAVNIGGRMGMQTQWTLSDGRRLWLIYPQYGLFNWSEDIGRIDTQTSAADPAGDTVNFEMMLNSFRFLRTI